MDESKNIYDFEVFKALVEIEIRKSNRYNIPKKFSIAFLYAPNIATIFKNKNLDEIDIAFIIKDEIRKSDVISPVEEDFVFLFFPETDKEKAKKAIERIKEKLQSNIIEGIASFPEDGKTPSELYNKLVDVMNEKLIPIVEFDSE